MKRILLHFALAAVISACTLAQQSAIKVQPTTNRLREHVTYLASDKLEGRRTGTEGARVAAKFIEEEFNRHRLGPGYVHQTEKQKNTSALSATYSQPFPYVASVELGEQNMLSLSPRVSGMPAMEIPRQLRLGVDWMPLGWSANAQVESLPATYVGYGITAADLRHDDYAGVDATGRAVIAFAGTPDRDHPHGRFARYHDLRFKAAAARDHGAKALILVAREEKFQDDKLAKLVFDNANAGDAGIPVVVISRQIARRVLQPLANSTVTLELSETPGTGGANNDTKKTDAQTAPATPNGNPGTLDKITFTLSTDIVRRETQAQNVIGVLEGSDPQLKNEAVVIGAHYDHLGRGGQGSLAQKEGEIHHGADDNASGVAALLELARQFSSATAKPRRTIIFLAFAGEEDGLLGSKHYVEHPSVPLANTIAMINLDMVGRMKDDQLVIGGVGTAAEWRDLIARINAEPTISVHLNGSGGRQQKGAAAAGEGVPAVTGANGETVASISSRPRFNLSLNEDGFGPSDHSSFYAKQTPVLFFFTGTHEDYHKPSDTADRVNYEGLTKIVGFVGDLVGSIDASDRRPTYTLAKSSGMAGRSTGFRVSLGTIPSYAEGNAGLKLDGVREGSPAEKAGLKANDVIVKMAGREIRNVYDYTYLLGEMKPGQEYEVEVMRGGERLILKITPAARKQ